MQPTWRSRSRKRFGFTVIELVIVLVLSAMLTILAIPRFTQLEAQRRAANARDAVIWLAAKARSAAIEHGVSYEMDLDADQDRAWLLPRGAADTLQVIDFAAEYGVEVSSEAASRVTLCYSPRGFAFSCDANSPSTAVDFVFSGGHRTATARIRPLGQVDKI